jgi:hypothetical protein
MTKQPGNARRPPHFVVLGIVLGGLGSVVALAAMALIAWEKVQTGLGWESYRTHWLVEFNWVGFLVLLAAVGIALVVALQFRLKEWRELQALERNGKGRHG